ncbi:MAG TPA: DEAD/DEAH box helicase [Candidatus Thermoplasmatota archaeon]|nr:DEAD/DEAH box helicase [Candidatus Thermoplasmatota archaeon]
MKLRYRRVGDRCYVRIVDDVASEARVWRSLQMMGAPLEVDKDPRALTWSRYVPEAAFPKLERAARMLRASLEPEPGEAPVATGSAGAAYAKARPVDVPAVLRLAQEDPAQALAALRTARVQMALFAKDNPSFAADSRRDLRALDEAIERAQLREREALRDAEKEAAREISVALKGVSADDVWRATTELAALRKRAEQEPLAPEPDYDLPEAIPGFRGRLRPYQRDGVRFLAARGLNAILADEMGLGKTVMTIAAVLARDARALVVGPANVLYNWADEIERFADEVPLVYHERRRIGNPRSRFLVTTYDALRTLDPADPDVASRDVLVLDEAHYVRNPETQRARLVKALPQRRRLLLTGTPLVNSIEDYYELLEQVDPRRFASRADFKRSWTVDPALFNKYAEVRALAAEYLQRATRDVLLRRRKADVLADLPPRVITVTRHAMPPADERAYNQLEAKALETMRKAQSDVAVFAAIHSLRHHLAVSRVEAVRERVQELLEAGENVVVYSQYLEPLRRLQAAFPHEAATLDGATPPKRRMDISRTLGQEGGPRVVLAQMDAGGIGLNFTAARHVLFVHLGWTPASHAQAMDRVHRIGQDRGVQVEFFVTPGTIDERMARILLRKEADQNIVLAEGSDLLNRQELARMLAEDAEARNAAEKDVAFGPGRA